MKWTRTEQKSCKTFFFDFTHVSTESVCAFLNTFFLAEILFYCISLRHMNTEPKILATLSLWMQTALPVALASLALLQKLIKIFFKYLISRMPPKKNILWGPIVKYDASEWTERDFMMDWIGLEKCHEYTQKQLKCLFRLTLPTKHITQQ